MLAPQSISYDYLLKKAWPIILANASVPLLGLVDTSVIGNVGTAQDLGAIAFGALIFSFVYWGFGFLRMGTTGFAAQANGAGDQEEVRAVLARSLLLAVCLGLILILLQWPIKQVAFSMLNGSESVEQVAQSYFSIRIWGAPATLCTFALMGLLIGLGNSGQLLVVQLFLNGLNMALDIWFAGFLGWGAQGIALGTVIAEWVTVVFASVLIFRELAKRNTCRAAFLPIQKLRDRAAFLKLLSANADIMVRTLILVFSFAYFVNQSASFGDVSLAANHILLQLISFAAFFLDGYAFVVESLVGSARGSKEHALFDAAVKKSTILAAFTALMLAAALWFFGGFLIAALTDISAVRLEAAKFLPLAGIYIFLSFAAFQLDGIFIGAAFTREMRHAAMLSIVVFLVSCKLFIEPFAMLGLWWAMVLFVVARAVALLLFYPRLRAAVGT
ncbi:MAG: MATE family multidrug resistance protein [Pseudohongiellaceae bacterium]|jgi:MATE family multidrug resistance protein